MLFKFLDLKLNVEIQSHDTGKEWNDWLEEEDNLKLLCKRKFYEVPLSDNHLQ